MIFATEHLHLLGRSYVKYFVFMKTLSQGALNDNNELFDAEIRHRHQRRRRRRRRRRHRRCRISTNVIDLTAATKQMRWRIGKRSSFLQKFASRHQDTTSLFSAVLFCHICLWRRHYVVCLKDAVAPRDIVRAKNLNPVQNAKLDAGIYLN